MLAISSAERCVRLVDVWTGKVVHRLSTSERSPLKTTPKATAPSLSRTSCLAYASTSSTSIPTRRKAAQLDELDAFESLEDLLARDSPSNSNGVNGHAKPDLPRELATLDIESSLPKLSTLPATGGEYVFQKTQLFPFPWLSHSASQDN